MISIRCRLEDVSGYGQLATELLCDLSRYLALDATPLTFDYRHGIPEPLRKFQSVSNRSGDASPELYIHSLGSCHIHTWRRTAFFTMWESTRVPAPAIGAMNKCQVIIVPNAFNAATFSAQGIVVPIRIVPLGIDVEKYPAVELPNEGPFTIGTAAATFGVGSRKGLGVVVEAFGRAFRSGQNVRLRVRSIEKDPPVNSRDSRVEVSEGFINQAALNEWYSSLHVFASGSPGEGWGRMQHEAMATGRPAIGVNFGGVMEFFNTSNGYAVGYQLGKATGYYDKNGDWPILDVDSMADQMMRAYSDRGELSRKSQASRASALEFPISRMTQALIKVLHEFQFIS
jgi:glycosyltransferase involved in cell wall biosynthesis